MQPATINTPPHHHHHCCHHCQCKVLMVLTRIREELKRHANTTGLVTGNQAVSASYAVRITHLTHQSHSQWAFGSHDKTARTDTEKRASEREREKERGSRAGTSREATTESGCVRKY